MGHLGGILGRLGVSWRVLGASWAPLGPSWARLGPQKPSNINPDSTWNGKRRSFFLCVLVSGASAVLWGLECVLGRKIRSKSTPKRFMLVSFGVILGVWAPPGRLLAPKHVLDGLGGGFWVALGRFLARLGGLLGGGALGRIGGLWAPKVPPRGPKRHPRGLQEAPKRPQETPKRPRRAFWGLIGVQTENAYFSNTN